MTAPHEVRTLLWDIETAPNRGWTWGKYEQNVIAFEQEWYVLTVAYKWLGDKTTHVKGLDDFPKRYKKDDEDDYELTKLAWDLFNEADIVVAHNGVAFDTKKIQARMIFHGFDPPTSFKEFDTLQTARKNFAFTSNKLDDLCQHLGLGEKVATGGFDLWKGVMRNDPKSWALMKKYNKHDVVILERLYLKLRPWSKNHPNLATMADRPDACPKCGSEKGMVSKGFNFTTVSKRQRFKCKACGASCSGRKTERTDTQFVS